jgi:hypothetical protein
MGASKLGGALSALLLFALRVAVTLFGAYTAFEIRTYAIREYGPLIHECVSLPGKASSSARAQYSSAVPHARGGTSAPRGAALY